MEKTQQMLALVKQWRESGLTQKEFCRASEIKMGTFNYWVSRSREVEKKGFISLMPETGHSQKEFEVIYPNGVRLKLSSIDLKTLAGLIRLY
jgi:hypothetical protein